MTIDERAARLKRAWRRTGAEMALLILAYHCVAFAVWQLRNPKANAATFYTCYPDVIKWKRLPEFQK